MIEIAGNWHKGFAYSLHTLSSDFIGYDDYGHPQFETTYSEMGKLVHQLKYRGDKAATTKIVDLLGIPKIVETCDLIIPAPSSNKMRKYQPVVEIALELGSRADIKVLIGVLEKKEAGKQLKDISDPDERIKELKRTIYLSNTVDISGKTVLLLDDLYRSEATLRVSTDILYNQGKVGRVSVLTMTKTRRNR